MHSIWDLWISGFQKCKGNGFLWSRAGGQKFSVRSRKSLGAALAWIHLPQKGRRMRFNVYHLAPFFLHGILSIRLTWVTWVYSYKLQGLGLNPWFHLLHFTNNFNGVYNFILQSKFTNHRFFGVRLEALPYALHHSKYRCLIKRSYHTKSTYLMYTPYAVINLCSLEQSFLFMWNCVGAPLYMAGYFSLTTLSKLMVLSMKVLEHILPSQDSGRRSHQPPLHYCPKFSLGRILTSLWVSLEY